LLLGRSLLSQYDSIRRGYVVPLGLRVDTAGIGGVVKSTLEKNAYQDSWDERSNRSDSFDLPKRLLDQFHINFNIGVYTVIMPVGINLDSGNISHVAVLIE
jgi:hypothetical protein